MFPTLISKRLLGDFLWCRKLYRFVHRASSNNFGVVRVNGSNTWNYMVWLCIYPFSVICRSSLFSLQIKKEFQKQVCCLYFTCDVIASIKKWWRWSRKQNMAYITSKGLTWLWGSGYWPFWASVASNAQWTQDRTVLLKQHYLS